MKKIVFRLILISCLVFMVSVAAHAAENPWEQKLPFKTATVTYKMSGNMTGDKTIYVKDYGMTTAEYSTMTMKMFGMTTKQEEVIITTPDWVYTADLTENTGTKNANPKKYMLEEYNSLSKSDQKKVVNNAEKMGISTIEGMNGTLEKKAVTILGYPCDKVTLMGTTAYTIHGSELPLKVEGDTMGMKISQVATDIKTGKAPSSKFELPKGIHFEHNAEADRMIKAQAQTAIQNLVEGKNPVSEQQFPQSGGYQQSGGYSQPAGYPQAPSSPQQSQAGQVMEKDAKDVGQAAHQEAKDATMDEVREEVRNAFKSLFD